MKMLNRFKNTYILAGIIFCLYAQNTLAIFIGPITTSPTSPISIANQAGLAVVNWNGVSDTANSTTSVNLGQPYTVFSTGAVFSGAQNSFSVTSNQSISTTLVFSGGSNNFSIRETIRIPREVLTEARKNNTTLITYSRQFVDGSDSSTSQTTSITLRITNSAGGALTIEQIDLRFSNESIADVIRTDESLSAYANINHAGSGLFSAVWEIATPSSTIGTPIFYNLGNVRQVLSTGRNTIIESPPLPTNLTGNYLLRLRTLSPAIEFEALQLRYSVIPSNKPVIPVKKILLTTPPENSVVTDATVFNWKPINNAIAYQLEIIAANSAGASINSTASTALLNTRIASEPLSAGILLPSDKSTSTLTKLALRRLKAGRNYYWRTIAVDKDGNIIGESEFRAIRIK